MTDESKPKRQRRVNKPKDAKPVEEASTEAAEEVIEKPEVAEQDPVKFVFIGNGDNDPKNIVAHGVEFELNGEPQEVPHKKIKKFAGNSHFKAE